MQVGCWDNEMSNSIENLMDGYKFYGFYMWMDYLNNEMSDQLNGWILE
jgi:hypothetical protein